MSYKADMQVILNPPKYMTLFQFFEDLFNVYFFGKDSIPDIRNIQDQFYTQYVFRELLMNDCVDIIDIIDYMHKIHYLDAMPIKDVLSMFMLSHRITESHIRHLSKYIRIYDDADKGSLTALHIKAISNENDPLLAKRTSQISSLVALGSFRFDESPDLIVYEKTRVIFDSKLSISEVEKAIENELQDIDNPYMTIRCVLYEALKVKRITWTFAHNMMLSRRSSWPHIRNSHTQVGATNYKGMDIEWLYEFDSIPNDLLPIIKAEHPVLKDGYISSCKQLASNHLFTSYNDIIMTFCNGYANAINKHELTIEYIYHLMQNSNMNFELASYVFTTYIEYSTAVANVICRNSFEYEMSKVDRYKNEISKASKVVVIIQRWWRDVSQYNPRRWLAKTKLHKILQNIVI